MTVSVARFKKAFPDFRDTSFDLCQQKLDIAHLLVSPRVCGAKTDYMIMLQTADMIATAPEGEKSRLVSGETRYAKELQRLTRIVTMGVSRVS